ncbi:MAG: formyltransferase [Burkholderiales bacterium]
MTTAVAFAYHNVGVRCLHVLLAQDVRVPLVVTHFDSLGENIWFESVAAIARRYDIAVATPDDPNTGEFTDRISTLRPDFVFSFYYRRMLKPALLSAGARGALNMHGSLLPKYRGRAPINWAVINGERETGATLHYMVGNPDAGDIVDQQAVPILADDTALEVFGKVTVAAEITLNRSLPRLIDGTAPRIRQDLSLGSYFPGRKPEDGRIDWSRPAAVIHNLVRGVAPPYPGAFTSLGGKPARILRTRIAPARRGPLTGPCLFFEDGHCYAQCADGGVLRIIELELDGRLLAESRIEPAMGERPLPLGITATEKS